MQGTVKSVLLGLALLAGPAALAQETTTAPAPETTETSAPEAPAADAPAAEAPAAEAPASEAPAAGGPSDLALGEPVASDTVGQPYIRETFGDWSLRCLNAPEGQEDPCQIYQLLLDETGKAVAEVSMFPLPGGGQAVAGGTIVAPLETLLPQQLNLTIDGGEARRYPFTFCNAAGCVSRVGFTAEELALFKRGNAANLRLVPAAAPDQEVNLRISLSGFTAAFDSMPTPE